MSHRGTHGDAQCGHRRMGGALVVVACLLWTACSSSAPTRPEASGWPVILVHGFAGSPSYPVLGSYFRGIDEALLADGVFVTVPELPPYADSAERAKALDAHIDQLLAKSPGAKVHIIGHSQGGLDARVLIEHLGSVDKVASLTTLSTPHRGTPVADAFEWMPDPLLNLALSAANVGQGTLEMVDGASAVKNLSGRSGRGDVDAYPVPAFSLAGVVGEPTDNVCAIGLWGSPYVTGNPQTWLVPSYSALSASAPGVVRSNDGLVPVDSAIWQNFLGCLPADHVAMVGLGLLAPEQDDPPFDPAQFFVAYVRALRALEREGTAANVIDARPPLVGRYWH